MRLRRLATCAVVGLVAAAAAAGTVPAQAAGPVRCSFGGPAGTSRILRLDLPTGSSFLNVNLTGGRVLRPAASTESWHLARGVFILDSLDHELVSYRIASEGSSTRRTVVEADGVDRVDVATPGPDAPFTHTDLRLVPNLPPGSYLVAAFGSDGDPALPNDGWGGFIEVSDGACTSLGSGELLDVNHADFTGGTQVSTTGVGVIDGASLSRTLDRELVVGFVDASVQIAGEAAVDYDTPAGAGTVEDRIAPFSSPGGAFRWTARAAGVAPIVAIAALAFDVP